MCLMCNGADLDDVLFHIHALIERVGWTVVPVVGDRVSQSWAYTIGLAEKGHPEFFVAGMGPEEAGELLNTCAQMALMGFEFDDGEEFTTGGMAYRFARIPERHFSSDTFAFWVNYYGALDRRPECDALELVPEGRRRALT